MMMTGCAIRSVYVPLTQNVPLFDSSKQIKACGYLGSNHVELQVAHNPTNHFAFAANAEFGTGISVYNGAIGIHTTNRDAKWRYELFGGYGYNTNVAYDNGNILSSSQKVSYDVNSTYHQFYLQPGIGFFGKINMYRISYTFSFSTKLSYLYFNEYMFREKDVSVPASLAPRYIVSKDYANKEVFTIEPCISNKVGLKNLFAVLQVQSITPYSQHIDVSNTKFSPGLFFSIGLQYVFTFKVK